MTTQPTFIIFNNNNNGQQTSDLTFVNGGYYNESGLVLGVVTDIATITSSANQQPSPLYSLDGRKVSQPTKPGIYIRNKKKIVIR